jgi:hypothetical protein
MRRVPPALLGLVVAMAATACGPEPEPEALPPDPAAREQTAIDTLPNDTLPPPVTPVPENPRQLPDGDRP